MYSSKMIIRLRYNYVGLINTVLVFDIFIKVTVTNTYKKAVIWEKIFYKVISATVCKTVMKYYDIYFIASYWFGEQIGESIELFWQNDYKQTEWFRV